ncbi:MAG TPA: hypothetical protein VF096_05895, partial [Azonexus sp.]
MQQAMADMPVADDPVLLRQERRFNVLAGKEARAPGVGVGQAPPANKDDPHPLFLVADRMDGQADRTTVAEGNVELRKAGSLVFADRV